MEALFLKLVNLSFSAVWLILAVVLIRLVFRRAPKWVFCLLWALVGLRLLCPVSIESALSLVPSAEPLPQEILYTATPEIQSGIPVLDGLVNPTLSTSLAPSPGSSVNPTQVWSFVLSRLWAFGGAVMLLYAVISYWILRRRVATATLLRDNIRQSDRVPSPFVLGVFRPGIYLPYSVPEEDLNFVIAHERAHIRRKDHWWKPLGFLLLSVYWFNPFVWLAYLLLCRDIEGACDEAVIRGMEQEEKQAYSAALLRCSVRRRAVAAYPLAFGETGVKSRIKSVMNYKQPAFWVVLLALAAALAAAVCLFTVPAIHNSSVRITVPAGSVSGFFYSEEEISPRGTSFTVTAEQELPDAEVILKPVAVQEGSAYDTPTALKAGASALLEAEQGGWFRLGVKVQNPTEQPMTVTLKVENVQVRGASELPPELEKYRTEYVGDAPKVSKIAQLLPYPGNYRYSSIEIESSRKPYGLTVRLTGSDPAAKWEFAEAAAIAFRMIGNLGVVSFWEGEDHLGSFETGDPAIEGLLSGRLSFNGQSLRLESQADGSQTLSPLTEWFDYWDSSSELTEQTAELSEFPGVAFRYRFGEITAETEDGDAKTLISGMPIWNACFADVTGDGIRDLCATCSYGSGLIDNRIQVYDIKSGVLYELADRGNVDFILRVREEKLLVEKRSCMEGTLLETGRLGFDGNRILFLGGDVTSAVSEPSEGTAS